MSQYPTSAYTYFRIDNKVTEKHRFISGVVAQPEFIYKDVSEGEIERRIKSTIDERARQNLELVLASLQLRQHQTSNNLGYFRRANAALYEIPRPSDVGYILDRTQQKVTHQTSYLWEYIKYNVALPAPDHTIQQPSSELFKTMQEHLERYIALHDLDSPILYEAIEKALIATGLVKQGWSIQEQRGPHFARTIHAQKTIVIGADYSPRTQKAIRSIVLHEVYGHALRNVADDFLESEGFATMLEQLSEQKFTTKRSYRYVAAALGWGVLDKPRTFREVYEIIWRLMVIRGKYKENTAKEHAFDECARVFRGGIPNLAGSVYLKDTIYFIGNMKVWQRCIDDTPSYDDFVDIIEGRKKLL